LALAGGRHHKNHRKGFAEAELDLVEQGARGDRVNMIAVPTTADVRIYALVVVFATTFGANKTTGPFVFGQVLLTTIVIFELIGKFKNVHTFENVHN
jgi:hypothetical protein